MYTGLYGLLSAIGSFCDCGRLMKILIGLLCHYFSMDQAYAIRGRAPPFLVMLQSTRPYQDFTKCLMGILTSGVLYQVCKVLVVQCYKVDVLASSDMCFSHKNLASGCFDVSSFSSRGFLVVELWANLMKLNQKTCLFYTTYRTK